MKSKRTLGALAWLQSCCKAGEELARSPGEDRAPALRELHSKRKGGRGDSLQEGSSQMGSRKKPFTVRVAKCCCWTKKAVEFPSLQRFITRLNKLLFSAGAFKNQQTSNSLSPPWSLTNPMSPRLGAFFSRGLKCRKFLHSSLIS